MISDNLYVELQKLNKQYEEYESLMSNKQKNQILENVKSFKQMYTRFIMSADRYDHDQALKHLEFLNFVFKILSIKKTTATFNDLQSKQKLIVKVDTLLETYGNKEIIKNEIIKPFLSNAYAGSNLPARSIYLVGEPGVGKTKFVTELADILDSVFITVDYSTIKSHSQKYAPHSDFKIEEAHLISKARFAMTEAGKSLCIIFFDELDKNLSANSTKQPSYYGAVSETQKFLLQMLNSDLRAVEDPYLGFDVLTTNILIVAAGNKKLADIGSDYSALDSRFITIEFPNLEHKLKEQIAVDYAHKKFAQANLSITDTDINAIEAISSEDENPGVRILKMKVESYVGNRLADSVFAGTSWEAKSIVDANTKAVQSSLIFSKVNDSNVEPLIDTATFTDETDVTTTEAHPTRQRKLDL